MYTLTEEEKRSIIFHINVEIFTFNECYTKLQLGEEKAALECFLLHARNLHDFLVTPLVDRYRDDVLAADFIFEKIPIEFPDGVRDRINVQLQHISYSRLSDKQKSLFEERDKIYQSIKDGLNRYNAIASQEYRLNQLV